MGHRDFWNPFLQAVQPADNEKGIWCALRVLNARTVQCPDYEFVMMLFDFMCNVSWSFMFKACWISQLIFRTWYCPGYSLEETSQFTNTSNWWDLFARQSSMLSIKIESQQFWLSANCWVDKGVLQSVVCDIGLTFPSNALLWLKMDSKLSKWKYCFDLDMRGQ